MISNLHKIKFLLIFIIYLWLLHTFWNVNSETQHKQKLLKCSHQLVSTRSLINSIYTLHNNPRKVDTTTLILQMKVFDPGHTSERRKRIQIRSWFQSPCLSTMQLLCKYLNWYICYVIKLFLASVYLLGFN